MKLRTDLSKWGTLETFKMCKQPTIISEQTEKRADNKKAKDY